MKRTIPYLIVLSLLIGIIGAVATTRVSGLKQSSSSSNCGFSVSSKTNVQTPLKYCLLSTYGWPVKYATSGVVAELRDYHTNVSSDPSNASSFIGFTSFSRLRFVADWAIWSVAGLVLVMSIDVLSSSSPKKKSATRKKK